MKKSNLIKLFSVLLIATMAMVMMFNTAVLAAEDDDEEDEDEIELTLDNNTNTNSNNTNTNNTNTNTNNTNKANNTNNSSIYNNTNLPKTGVSQSIPVAVLIVVFGISAVYAYKKIKDYKNI